MERRRHRIVTALGMTLALGLIIAPGAGAQGGKQVARSLCDALTPREVRRAADVRMDGHPDLYACYWRTTDIGDPERGITMSWLSMTFEELKAIKANAVELTIGGYPALYDPVQWTLDVGLPQGVLVLTATSLQDMDWQPALTGLGELVAGRSADLVAPPPLDAELAAMFPSAVGDEQVDLAPAYADQVFPGEFDPGKALRRALKRANLGLGDVALATAVLRPSLAGIYALRVPGADAAAFGFPATSWLMGVGWTAVPEEYANGAINTVTGATGGSPAYVYPKDDVVWVIQAEEPQLSQILGALPGAPTVPGHEVPTEGSAPSAEASEPAGSATAGSTAGSVEDLIPTSVGGEELVVQTMQGSSGGGFNDPKSRTYKALTKGLESQGKTIDDLTLSAAADANGELGIIGIEVDGADANAFVTFAIETVLSGLSSRKHEKEPGEVAGKAVTVLRPQQARGRIFHIYPQGDIVWIVGAPDAMLEEVFAALP